MFLYEAASLPILSIRYKVRYLGMLTLSLDLIQQNRIRSQAYPVLLFIRLIKARLSFKVKITIAHEYLQSSFQQG